MVMPLIACAVGHAPRHAYHVSHPLPVPWSCTLLPARFVACALRCPCPSSPSLCVAPLITHVVCHAHRLCHGHAPRRAYHVSRPSSHAPCIVPIAHAVVVHL